jgi:hypothetical protein
MDTHLHPHLVTNELLMNMEAATQAQINEARSWIRDCSWLDEAEDLEDLTDEEVRRGIDLHYDGGWTQFLANRQLNQ